MLGAGDTAVHETEPLPSRGLPSGGLGRCGVLISSLLVPRPQNQPTLIRERLRVDCVVQREEEQVTVNSVRPHLLGSAK